MYICTYIYAYTYIHFHIHKHTQTYIYIYIYMNILIAMKPLLISFFFRSTYYLLPNATKRKLWGYIDSDLCLLCKRDRGTLRHVLSPCPQSLQMYTW